MSLKSCVLFRKKRQIGFKPDVCFEIYQIRIKIIKLHVSCYAFVSNFEDQNLVNSEKQLEYN